MTKKQRIEQLEQRVAELIGQVEKLKAEIIRSREPEFFHPLNWLVAGDHRATP